MRRPAPAPLRRRHAGLHALVPASQVAKPDLSGNPVAERLDLRQAFVARPGLCPRADELSEDLPTMDTAGKPHLRRIAGRRARDDHAHADTDEDVERLAEAAARARSRRRGESACPRPTAFRRSPTGAGWAQAMVGAALATRFPGPGTVLMRHSFEVMRSAAPGDALSLTLTVQVEIGGGTARRDRLPRDQSARRTRPCAARSKSIAPPEKIVRGAVRRPARRSRARRAAAIAA